MIGNKIRTMKIKARGIGKLSVRLTRKWRGHPVGTILNPPAALRSSLVKQQIAEIIDPEIPAVEAPPMTKEETPKRHRKSRSDESGDDEA